ncbi:hypothetical protein ABEB36_004519 [Hypothenemus hampei]|uniref:Sodium channel protein Nach n=1 Tax=Hypothenemus hampei TaxID=57062 RepID=A0ABD1F494_HYPHA
MSRNGHSNWEIIKKSLKNSFSILSVSGLGYIYSDAQRSLLERIFWKIIMVMMITVATWHGIHVYSHYTERAVIVTLDKAYFNWKLHFPSATICFADLKVNRELKKLFDKLVTKFNISAEFDEFLQYLNDLAFKNYTNYEDYKPYADGLKLEYLEPKHYMEVLDEAMLSFDESLIKSSINFPLREFRPTPRVFTEIGPCIVVNPNISIYYTPKYFNSDDTYNLYKPIYLTADDIALFTLKKLHSFNNGNIYFHFHASNEVMEIMDRKEVLPHGVELNVRYEADIVIASEEVVSLSIKQKNCRLPYEPSKKPLEHSPFYSYNLCKFECRMKIAMKHCKCTPYYYRRTAKEPICNLTGLYCLSKYKSQLIYTNDSVVRCADCPQNCNTSIYRMYKVKEIESLQTTLTTTVAFPTTIFVRSQMFSRIDLVGKKLPFS